MDERELRLVRNEAVFRRVNERLKELGEAFSLVAEHAEFICECSRAACVERLELTLAEYEDVRSHPGQFVLVPGHEVDDIEDVVRHGEGYVVVRKPPGELEDAAVREDPRRTE